jgi:pyrroloquinoline quinone biosynthesis protein A
MLFIKKSKKSTLWRISEMRWEKPSYTDLRFGFEVTMYIYNR